jgi:hypothetical protein
MAEIAAGRLVAAARALMLAGRWDQASDLLGGAKAAGGTGAGGTGAGGTSAGDAERAVLAVAQAEVAVDQDFWVRTDGGAAALERASAAVARTGAADPALVFDLDFFRLKHDYGVELAGLFGGQPERDPAVLDDLARRAAGLASGAPDPGRRAWAAFYAGLIEDVLRGGGEAGRPWYAEALAAGEQCGDELIVSYALRHLGFLASADGDAELARRHWQHSKELRQRAGCVPLVLAQQVQLAELDRDAGQAAAARAIAAEVSSWSVALGCGWLEAGAAELLAVGPES